MGTLITDEATAVDRSSEFDQTAAHNHVDAGRCMMCNSPTAYEAAKLRAENERLRRDLHDVNLQLSEARDFVRQAQEDLTELCGILTNARR